MKATAAMLFAIAVHAMLPAPAAAQSAAEYAIGSAISGALGAAAKKTGDAANRVNRKLGEAVGRSASTEPAAKPARPKAAPGKAVEPAPAGPTRVYEDPAAIRAGMKREELLRRFGPATIISAGGDRELFLYGGGENAVDAELAGGVVVSVKNAQAPPGAGNK